MRGATLANKVDQIAASWLMGHLVSWATPNIWVHRGFSLLEMGETYMFAKSFRFRSKGLKRGTSKSQQTKKTCSHASGVDLTSIHFSTWKANSGKAWCGGSHVCFAVFVCICMHLSVMKGNQFINQGCNHSACGWCHKRPCFVSMT